MKTVSLELAKQLHEAGVEIETYFIWELPDKNHKDTVLTRSNISHQGCEGEHIPAPTTDELLEWIADKLSKRYSPDSSSLFSIYPKYKMVPQFIDGQELKEKKAVLQWGADFNTFSKVVADTPAEALAKLALWVKESQNARN